MTITSMYSQNELNLGVLEDILRELSDTPVGKLLAEHKSRVSEANLSLIELLENVSEHARKSMPLEDYTKVNRSIFKAIQLSRACQLHSITLDELHKLGYRYKNFEDLDIYGCCILPSIGTTFKTMLNSIRTNGTSVLLVLHNLVNVFDRSPISKCSYIFVKSNSNKTIDQIERAIKDYEYQQKVGQEPCVTLIMLRRKKANKTQQVIDDGMFTCDRFDYIKSTGEVILKIQAGKKGHCGLRSTSAVYSSFLDKSGYAIGLRLRELNAKVQQIQELKERKANHSRLLDENLNNRFKKITESLEDYKARIGLIIVSNPLSSKVFNGIEPIIDSFGSLLSDYEELTQDLERLKANYELCDNWAMYELIELPLDSIPERLGRIEEMLNRLEKQHILE